MYDSIAPVCFDVLTFFLNALLIITHWRLLTPTSASVAPFTPPELHPSLLAVPLLLHPSPAPEPCPGIGLLVFGKGGGGGGVRGNDMGLEIKGVAKTYQRAERKKHCIIIGCRGNQTRLHFFQPSFPSAPCLHLHAWGGKQGGGGEWARLEFLFAHLSVCTCVFACYAACGKHPRDTAARARTRWPKHKCRISFVAEQHPHEWDVWFTDSDFSLRQPVFCINATGECIPEHWMTGRYLLLFSLSCDFKAMFTGSLDSSHIYVCAQTSADLASCLCFIFLVVLFIDVSFCCQSCCLIESRFKLLYCSFSLQPLQWFLISFRCSLRLCSVTNILSVSFKMPSVLTFQNALLICIYVFCHIHTDCSLFCSHSFIDSRNTIRLNACWPCYASDCCHSPC